MSAELGAAGILTPADRNSLPSDHGEITTHPNPFPTPETESGKCAKPSAWSQSGTKRFFDQACVLASLPVLVPALLLVALAVRLTSSGPILFLQERIGHNGRPFTILKFRTMENVLGRAGAQRFTPAGRFLRRWKLDELPQLLNVLTGQMSLVGPRPKMREYQLGIPTCRPGITGAATIAFACEELLLEQVASLRASDMYRSVVMPAKQRLDAEYMARATFASDLTLILATLLRRWDRKALQAAIGTVSLGLNSCRANQRFARLQGPSLPKMSRSAEAVVAVSP